MGKKIIILNGSPRPKGNTAGLVAAFTEGAEESGNTVTSFFLDGMKINGCKGCLSGGKDTANPCVQKDDMNEIYTAYNDADVVVMASPLYFWNLSGQLRTAVDRLFATVECDADFNIEKKSCALLMAAEGHDFNEVTLYHNKLMEHLGWDNLGTVLAGGVNRPGDIAGKPELEEARKLGASIR